MTHPQNNFTSQFQEGASSGNAALTLNINGVSQTYTPQGTDQTIAISEPVVFESSENPTFAEVNEVIGTHNPVYIHVSGIGVDYMIPYVGQSGDGNKLYFVIPDAQVGGFRYHIIRNGAPPDIGVKSVTDFLESYMTNPVEGKTIAASLNELNARLSSVEDAQTEKNIGDRTADSLDAQSLSVGGVPVKRQQTPKSLNGSTAKTVTGFSQDENGELNATFDDIAFPDWTSAINAAVATCEKTANKKNTLVGYETSTTAYPSIKAVVDFVNSAMQNLGGKLITDNGDPFTDSSDLPSTTPYGGVDIADKDYAYIQNTGTAERWSATVSGSSVTWQQEYAISIPVFTPAQQAAIDSGATSTKVGNYDAHLINTNNPHNVTAAQVGALTPTGNGSNVTATFTAAGSRVNISTGEKLSVIFGKIAKWFADLKAVAFSGSYNDLSDKPTIPTVNNGKLTISRNGTDLGSFTANQSGLLGIDISVPTKTSDLVNDSLLINDGTLTITQNGTSKGTFTANQLGSTTIALTDTTYESKNETYGGTALSLVTTGDKYNWNRKQSALPIALSNPLRYDIQVVFAYNSTNADYSAKIGNSTGHPQIGGNDVPTYVNDGGNVIEGWRTPNIKCAYANITSSNALALIHNVQGAKGTLILDPFRILCRIDSGKIIIYAYAPVTASESWNNAVLDGCIQWVVTTSGNTESYVEEIDGRIPQDSSRTMVLGSANISATLKQKMQANITMRVRRSDLNVNCTFMVNASFSIIKPTGISDNAYVYAYSNMILY